MKPLGRQGVTLIELMIAVAIMASVIQAASATYLHVYKNGRRATGKSSIEQSSHFLNTYFVHRLESIGGGTIRPWASLWVEDNAPARDNLPSGAGSDRISFVEADSVLAPTCAVISTTLPDILTFDSPSGACCLTPAYDNRQVILTRGAYYSQKFLTSVNPVSCTARISAGQATGIDVPPATLPGWVGAVAAPVSVSTLWLDMASYELHEFRDLDNDRVTDAGEDVILASNILDLQLALGLDANRDTRIADTRSHTDEWLYNVTHASEPIGAVGGGLRNALPSDLRMIAIGLVLGDRTNVPPYNSHKILNGPSRTVNGWVLTKSLVEFRLRSTGVFLPNG